MGHSASKVGKRVLPATPSGKRPTEHATLKARDKGVPEHVRGKDGKDPQLLANLSKMGQVKIHNAARTVKTASEIADSYRARAVSEQQALSLVPNRLTAASLSDLLDERKRATTAMRLERLALSYAMDAGLLETLARHVNTPSVGPVLREVSSENGQEKVTMRAIWVERVE